MPDKKPAIDAILSDLPQIGRIAMTPAASNPMLAALIQQANALAQIAQWAQNVQRGLAAEQQAKKIPAAQDVLGLPADAEVELVPTMNGKAKA